jgi:hypothetical protein
MFPFTHPAACAIATATLLGTIVLARPLPATSGDVAQTAAGTSPSAREILAQATPLQAAPAPKPAPAQRPSTAAKATRARADAVEARIKALHSELHITAAEETLWHDVAQVMRDNAKVMVDLRKEEAKNVKSMSAVDALKSYAAVIDAHGDGIHKFISIFQPLYDSMSDAQKKTADAVFRSRTRAAAQRSK